MSVEEFEKIKAETERTTLVLLIRRLMAFLKLTSYSTDANSYVCPVKEVAFYDAKRWVFTSKDGVLHSYFEAYRISDHNGAPYGRIEHTDPPPVGVLQELESDLRKKALRKVREEHEARMRREQEELFSKELDERLFALKLT